ncbi:Pyridoxamine 5'-phosphate oxidase [Geoalkalibacter ferrihydriticus]|uniref:Pyridoxamine 5'-phosphate oxidase n=2 Tax=Geoalkalibacter ferrihydriticus TaxID=392333 RepID=A0A0C2ED74_9BACT|nr:pyridoxamine 5'-phosphate oxidase family protein [Geoalkalibacter ferrihydriticus]KIH76548.1 pyridoxamine 5'-phosphate oxidase [Geoalkalibacter ferrihydriticus DSM 17813]SDM00803.1 Pyridoxamine 5'-phosphate oxidase [Geoalkalibacter ferrihydriticus]
MDLRNYFATSQGTGVLSTADREGRVDSAIYARPHILADGTIAMIMRERLTHHNLQQNPYAAYLFRESGPGYRGVRLFLKKLREDADPELLQEMTRRCLSPEEDQARGPKFIVYFQLEKLLPLIGDGGTE